MTLLRRLGTLSCRCEACCSWCAELCRKAENQTSQEDEIGRTGVVEHWRREAMWTTYRGSIFCLFFDGDQVSENIKW